MRIVIVGGPHSGVGKTLACERALQALAGLRFGAIKLTVADGEFDSSHEHGASALAVADAAGICGRGASCGVCETVSAKVPSRTIVHPGAIHKVGTDTWRLAQAGATAVAWIITLRGAAPDAVEGAIRHLVDAGAEGVLIEGTTALEWMTPNASVMVVTDPGRKWKDVAKRRIGGCDLVLRNRPPEQPGTLAAPLDTIPATAIDCNLGLENDAGTQTYQRRLLELLQRLPERTPAGKFTA